MVVIKDFIRFLFFKDFPGDQWPLILGLWAVALTFAVGLVIALR